MISNKISKRVIVTGANRGIGLGFVNYYLQKEWEVVACCRSINSADNLQILSELYSDKLQIELLDVSQDNSITKLVKRINHLEFNLVINNAGVSINEDFGQWTSANFLKTFQINTIGVALLSQAIEPLIKKNGTLVNMSSGLASIEQNINPEMDFDAYAMSKAALNILSKRLASKLKQKGVCVIALSPGWVQTDMGGHEAPSNVKEAVQEMGDIIEKLTITDTGKFLSPDGKEIPW